MTSPTDAVEARETREEHRRQTLTFGSLSATLGRPPTAAGTCGSCRPRCAEARRRRRCGRGRFDGARRRAQYAAARRRRPGRPARARRTRRGPRRGRVGFADDRRLEHAGCSRQHRLDLDRRDVLARHFHHVAAPAVEVEAAVGVAAWRGRPCGTSRRERGCGGLGVVEVAGEQRDARERRPRRPRRPPRRDVTGRRRCGAARPRSRGSATPSPREPGRRARFVNTAGIVSVMP